MPLASLDAGPLAPPAPPAAARERGVTPEARAHAADGSGGPRGLHLLGSGQPPCGIGDFSALLLETLRGLEPGAHSAHVIAPGTIRPGAMWRAIGASDAVIANFPVVAWKRALFSPLAAFAMAALRGRGRIAILHEWGGMHRLRRLALRPVLALSQRIVMVSPQVRSELAADPLVGFLARRAVLLPLPPNLARPAGIAESPMRARLIAARRAGRLVLGHFGSIYPGKQPEAVLEIAAALKARGQDPLLVFIGSFIKASDGIEAAFEARVAALGLTDNVVVTGYVASPEALFGLFEAVEAFAYVLPEGLTSRRASILACLQSGRPVVVTAPARPDEFDHHPRFRALLDGGAIVPVPQGAGAEAYADSVLAARARPMRAAAIDAKVWFEDAALSLRGAMTPAPRDRPKG